MHAWQTVILAAVQGLAELLPVSSSAHVVVTEKLLGLDPSTPQMTLLLVMLHSGTMLAVIAYFWSRWARTFFSSAARLKQTAVALALALVLTGIVGECVTVALEHTLLASVPHAQIEDLFSHLEIVAPALAVAGALILIAGLRECQGIARGEITTGGAAWIGAVQGFCLPFRGFSRSGATISTALLRGIDRARAEDFSFALAVLLTPPVVLREGWRLVHNTSSAAAGVDLHTALWQGLFGGLCAFVAGLIALRWLSAWLEHGRWYLFGIYCLLAAGVVEWLYLRGY